MKLLLKQILTTTNWRSSNETNYYLGLSPTEESSIEAKPTNQRNIMKFDSIEALAEFFKQQGLVLSEQTEEHNSDECIDRDLAELEFKETLLLASVNVNILEVIQNTLNQDAPIRNEQADTLVKLAQVKSILGSC